MSRGEFQSLFEIDEERERERGEVCEMRIERKGGMRGRWTEGKGLEWGRRNRPLARRTSDAREVVAMRIVGESGRTEGERSQEGLRD